MSADHSYLCKTCTVKSDSIPKFMKCLVQLYNAREHVAKVLEIEEVEITSIYRPETTSVSKFLVIHKDHELVIMEDGCREFCICGNFWCCDQKQIVKCDARGKAVASTPNQ